MFGLIAFLAGMIFDLKDPHRLDAWLRLGSGCTFWRPPPGEYGGADLLEHDHPTGQFLLAAALALITILAP